MTTPTHDQLVLCEIDQDVAVLTLNRPERNNAWTVSMEVEYYRLLDECGTNPDVRVIVVTGSGKSFCPGMDASTLSEQASGAQPTTPHLRQPVTFPRSVGKPVIAAINGACAGIGLVAALNCDLRFISSAAKITTSFNQRGIMAEHGMAWTLSRAIGSSKAYDLLISGRVILGPEALTLGLADRVFSPEDLLSETISYARRVASVSSPVAMGVTKRQIYAAQESTHEEARTLAIRYWYGTLRDHDDFKEGVASYLQKRPPEFAPWDPNTPTDPPPLPEDYVRG